MPKRRREVRRLRPRCHCLPWMVCVRSANQSLRPCTRLQTDLCSQLRSSRNAEYSSRCPWTGAEGCRSLCRKSETQLPPWCTQLCEQKLKKKKKKPAATDSWDSLACPQSVVSQPNRCESFTAGSVSTTGGCCKSQSTAKIVRDRQDATPICPADPTPGGKARTMCSLGPSQKADLGIWGLAGARLQRDQPGD